MDKLVGKVDVPCTVCTVCAIGLKGSSISRLSTNPVPELLKYFCEFKSHIIAGSILDFLGNSFFNIKPLEGFVMVLRLGGSMKI